MFMLVGINHFPLCPFSFSVSYAYDQLEYMITAFHANGYFFRHCGLFKSTDFYWPLEINEENVAKIIKFPGLNIYYYHLLLKMIQAVNDKPALLVYYTLNLFTDFTLPSSFESQAHFMCYLYTLHIVLIKLYLKMQIAFI